MYLKKTLTANVTSGSVLQYQAVAKHVEIFLHLLRATSLHYPLCLGCFITWIHFSATPFKKYFLFSCFSEIVSDLCGVRSYAFFMPWLITVKTFFLVKFIKNQHFICWISMEICCFLWLCLYKKINIFTTDIVLISTSYYFFLILSKHALNW